MKPTRVLISYHFGPRAIPLGEQVSRAFERAGMTVQRFDSGVPKSLLDRPKRLIKSLSKLIGQKQILARHWEMRSKLATARRFEAAAKEFNPDLMLILRGEPIEPWVISELKRAHGAKAILWWVKTTRWSARMERDSLVFDAMFTIHQRLAGDHVLHMPAFALDRERYFRPEVREEGWPALFVGCWSERRQLYLESIANLPLAIIGPNWRKRLKPNHPLYPRIVTDWVAENELADCYRRATVVVDIGQIDRHADEGETMRVADVPACGAVLITEPSRAVEHYFRPGSVVCISTPAELQMQLESILADRDRLRRTAEQAWEDVQALPSFDEKVEVFLRAVRLLPSLAEE